MDIAIGINPDNIQRFHGKECFRGIFRSQLDILAAAAGLDKNPQNRVIGSHRVGYAANFNLEPMVAENKHRHVLFFGSIGRIGL